MIIPVASASDPRISPYIGVKERDLLREGGRFIVEGKIALERLALGSRFGVESVFVAENRVAGIGAVLGKFAHDVPVYTAPQAVMDEVTGFHLHRGVLAMARREREMTCEDLVASFGARSPLTLLALVQLSNHDNVGGCFRNAAALGADGVLLDAGSCDPLYRKSIRVSSGTALSLPFARSGDGSAMLAGLEAAGIEAWALTPSGGETLTPLAPPKRLALVLGAEGPGLPRGLMDRCRRVSIPMAKGIDSLNVATAGAIALAHVFSARA